MTTLVASGFRRSWDSSLARGHLLPIRRFGSPVRNVTTYRDAKVPGRVHVVVELLAPSTPSVKQTADGIRWLFHGNDMA